jgi:hypothetical protein
VVHSKRKPFTSVHAWTIRDHLHLHARNSNVTTDKKQPRRRVTLKFVLALASPFRHGPWPPMWRVASKPSEAEESPAGAGMLARQRARWHNAGRRARPGLEGVSKSRGGKGREKSRCVDRGESACLLRTAAMCARVPSRRFPVTLQCAVRAQPCSVPARVPQQARPSATARGARLRTAGVSVALTGWDASGAGAQQMNARRR